MATINPSIPHEQRTATQPRQNALHPVTLSRIDEINPNIRLLRLSAQDPGSTIPFLPGQWLDTFIPSLPRAGGFTITSTPSSARPSNPYLELAVQKSANPPAQWLFQPPSAILGSTLQVRVGGSFTYPPPAIPAAQISRLVLVAGGVGINPLVSIFKTLMEAPVAHRPREIHVLYSTKAASPSLDPQEILFLPRLQDLVAAAADPVNVTLSLYLTGTETGGLKYDEGGRVEDYRLPAKTFPRRIGGVDLRGALDGWRKGGMMGREGTVAYVCGPQAMTDETVEFLGKQEGMEEGRVLCEKWW